MPVVKGTDNPETLDQFDGVTNYDDIVLGYGGADTLAGLNGDDTLKGGGGADTLIGGIGSDTADYSDSAIGVNVLLFAGVGLGGTAEGDTYVSIENASGSGYDDYLTGDDTPNELYGMGGDDVLCGLGGPDHLDGGPGDDFASYVNSTVGVIVSLLGNVGAHGEAEGDTFTSIEHVFGSDHEDTIWGDNGDNNLLGESGNDTLKGWGGDDGLQGGAGADAMVGGTGDDVYFVDNVLDQVIEWDNEGTDLVQSDISYTLPHDVENLRLMAAGNFNATGNALNNAIWGTDGNNVIDGAQGADWMRGYNGNDIYMVDNAADAVVETGGQGLDEVRTGVSWTMTAGSDVEILRTTNDNGISAINLTGNSSGNQIIGNNGGNQINGGAGVDQLAGRGGNDLYFVDHANDSITENGGQGLDEVRTSVSYALTAGTDVENLRTTDDAAVAAINLTGNASGNVVRGNNGNNVLNGGAGNDELNGLGGQDSFLFNTALDAATNVDVIAGFSVADDTIMLDDAIFASLGLGTISAGQLVIGAAAQDADDRIIYNSGTGALSYDADGNGATAAIQFATLGTGLALTNLDFLVV